MALRGRIQVAVVLAGAQQAQSPSAGVAGVGAGGGQRAGWEAEGWELPFGQPNPLGPGRVWGFEVCSHQNGESLARSEQGG